MNYLRGASLESNVVRPIFNYIVPIFNKEDVLPQTLQSIDKCASAGSRIFTVIDGCTDRSEAIVDEFTANSGRNVEKIHMPNVHMLRSVNAALRRVSQGFAVISQDDILFEDPAFEDKILQLYGRMGPRLGVISLKLAANVSLASLTSRLKMRSLSPMIQEVDYIRGPDDQAAHACGDYERLYVRMAAINGPNIIPPLVRERVGLFDEALAPYGYDDPEYGLRAIQAGFINGLYPLKYRSDLEWGGTRRSSAFLRGVRKIHSRNRRYIWNKHSQLIRKLWRAPSVLRSAEPVDKIADIHIGE